MASVTVDELTLLVKSNVTQALAGLDKVEDKAQGVGSRLSKGAMKWGARIAKAGVAAGAVTAVASSKMAMDFESAMAQIEANVGTTGPALDKLKQAALDMGKDFGVSAEEAAKGLFFLQSAGLSVEDSISALRVSSQMAAMGLGDMETIANGLTTAMTNWGISSEEAGDVVAKAVELGKAAPEEMTKILNQNAAAAASVGMSFDDLATTSAYLTRVTGDANLAGTQMKGVLMKLIKPSQQGKKMVESLGISYEEFAKAVSTDPVNAIKEFDAAFAESGKSSNEWMGAVFEDSRAISGALAILNSDGDEMSAMFDSMADRAGKVEKGFGIIADTSEFKLKSALEGLKSALIPLGAIILEVVVPAIEWLADKLQVGIAWIKSLMDGSNETAEGVTSAFSAIKDIADKVIAFFVDNWPTIEETVRVIADAVMGIVQAIWEFVGPVVEDLVNFVNEHFEDWMEKVQEIMPIIEDVIVTVLGAIKEIWDIVWPYLQVVIETVFNAVFEIIRGVLNAIKGLIDFWMGLISGDWERAWDGIKAFYDGIWDAIYGTVVNIMDGIFRFLGGSMEKVATFFVKAWDDLRWGATDAFYGIVGGVATVLNAVIETIATGINNAIKVINLAIRGLNIINPLADIPYVSEVSWSGVTAPDAPMRPFKFYGSDDSPQADAGDEAALWGGSASKVEVNIGTVYSHTNTSDLANEIGWAVTKKGVS